MIGSAWLGRFRPPAAADEAGDTRSGPVARLMRVAAAPQFAVSALIALYTLGVSCFVPEMLSLDTLSDVVVTMLPLLLVVLGECFVLLVAEIDLSVTAVMSLGSIVAATLMSSSSGLLAGSPYAVPAALAAFLVVGTSMGLINGFCVAILGMPSFIVTLASMMFFAGAAVWYGSLFSTTVSVGDLPDSFVNLGFGSLLGAPIAMWLAAAVLVASMLILSRTLFGRWLVAAGLNRRSAIVSGVPLTRVIVACFVISGLLAGLAAAIATARIETGTPVLAQNMLLDVIGAAVIGGVSLFGGRGSFLGATLGVLFLAVLDKGLQLLGLSLFAVLAAKGFVILLAAVLDVSRKRLQQGLA